VLRIDSKLFAFSFFVVQRARDAAPEASDKAVRIRAALAVWGKQIVVTFEDAA
jgi:hypothetical protein